mmetsp:Transcript_19003/g.23941  ORF Transcript_19003/g.23941 Transcript_19003/m.23941 type:complete len:122 (+) Transcript_19003:393-758(+)
MMGSSMERPLGVVEVSGIGAGEMAAIKPFLERAFEDHLRLVRAGTATDTVTGASSSDKQVQQGQQSRSDRRSLRQSSRRFDEGEQQEDDDDALMEPTADEDPNDMPNDDVAVSRVRVRRYR